MTIVMRCPVCGKLVHGTRGKPVPRHALRGRYSRRNRCAGSGRDPVPDAKR